MTRLSVDLYGPQDKVVVKLPLRVVSILIGLNNIKN